MSGELALEDYQRYGRQMILDGFGLPAQLKLQRASVAVVGAGGLGCPALQYLAAAGVGRIGIIDHDLVELSNLQRQILHTESRLGMHKAASAAHAIKQFNSRIQLLIVTEALSSSNAVSLLTAYDVILDCTDNMPTRYLLSDVAVKLGKPLVSGAAQKFDGQLCTYNLGKDGPCYRCLFPKPPALEMTGSCDEMGILGAVTGIIGTMQALEAIKLITGLHDGKPSMLIYSALNFTPFRSIKMRQRRPTCPACGQQGQRIGEINETDYITFCGGQTPDWESLGMSQGEKDCRIRAKTLKSLMDDGKVAKIIDVRSETEFGICHLPESIHAPLSELVANPSEYLPVDGDLYVVCRLGNDSQIAAQALRVALEEKRGDLPIVVMDLIGGLRAWSKEADENFPVY